MFYSNPVITHVPKSDPAALVSGMMRLMQAATSRKLFLQRIAASVSWRVKIVFSLMSLKVRSYIRELREFAELLTTDRDFRNFHEGRRSSVPEYYHRRVDRSLGQ